MTSRRDFLRRLTLTAAGLLVAEDALELLAEPRRYWPGATFAQGPGSVLVHYGDEVIAYWPMDENRFEWRGPDGWSSIILRPTTRDIAELKP